MTLSPCCVRGRGRSLLWGSIKPTRGRNPEEIARVYARLGYVEARVRIELTHKGFADLSLTTWVPRLKICDL